MEELYIDRIKLDLIETEIYKNVVCINKKLFYAKEETRITFL